MKKVTNIAFLGGDDRSVHAMECFGGSGYEVASCGMLDKMSLDCVKISTVYDAVKFADALILPIPMTRDQKSLSYSNELWLDDIVESIDKNENLIVFGGMIPSFFEEKLKDLSVKVFDYAKDEYYLQASAELTAKAFFDFIKDKRLPSLNNSKVAICGFGRIGKNLIEPLVRLNAQIQVFSSKSEEYNKNALPSVVFYDYKDAALAIGECDAVINTAPSHVLDMQAIKSLPSDALFYELASAPFGIDEVEREYLGARYIKAPGLPGVYYPKESGELIYKSVLSFLG